MLETGENKNLRVKLVAIAKDEAAYLPEWIFHHLYFGFDSIDIYVNNTTDNTNRLKLEFSSIDTVSFLNGDDFFKKGAVQSQQKVYSSAFFKAKELGFTHIIYLDIDEFWTPADMKSSIKDCISSISADVISFEWMNKFEDSEFSFAIEKKIICEHHRLVKSLTDLTLDFEILDIHNIASKNSINVLANGEKAIFSQGNQQLDSIGDIKLYFIIHRMYRSQMEYVSLLGRGRPRGGGTFKDNRNGFCYLEYERKSIDLDSDDFNVYILERKAFFDKYLSENSRKESQEFIRNRYFNVLNLISNAGISDFNVIRKILRNLKDENVNRSFSIYLNNVLLYLTGDVTDSLRDAAIIMEKKDVKKSLRLMEVAECFRPNGKIIKNKIKAYKSKILN